MDPEDQLAIARSAEAIQNRISYIPPTFVKDNPYTSSLLITSNIPDAMLADLGRGLVGGWPWIKSQTGPDGMYAGNVADTLNTQDEAGRYAGLIGLDIARHKANLMPGQPGFTGPLVPQPQSPVPSTQPLVGILDRTTETPSGIPLSIMPDPKTVYLRAILAGENPGTAGQSAYLAAMLAGYTADAAYNLQQQLTGAQFTDADVKSVQDQGLGQSQTNSLADKIVAYTKTIPGGESMGAAVTQLTQIIGGLVSKPFDLVASGVARAVTAPVQGGLQISSMGLSAVGLSGAAKTLGHAATDIEQGGQTFAHGFMQGVGVAFGRGTDIVAGGIPGALDELIKAARGQPASVGDWFHQYLWPHDPGQAAGRALADLSQIPHDSPWYDAVANVGNLVAQLYFAHKVAEVGAGLKEAYTVPLPDVITPEFEAQMRVQYGRIGAEFRKLAGSTLDQWAEGTTVTDWLRGRTGQRFGDRVVTYVTDPANAGTEAAVLSLRFGWDPKLAESIARSAEFDGPAGAISAYTAHWRNLPDPYVAALAFERLQEVDARLAIPEPLTGAIPQTPAELADLKAEKAVLEARLNDPSPVSIDPEMRYPKVRLARQIRLGLLDSPLGHVIDMLYNPRIHVIRPFLARSLRESLSDFADLKVEGYGDLGKELSTLRDAIHADMTFSENEGVRRVASQIADSLRSKFGDEPTGQMGEVLKALDKIDGSPVQWGSLPLPRIAAFFDGIYEGKRLKQWIGPYAENDALRWNMEHVANNLRMVGAPRQVIAQVVQGMLDVTSKAEQGRWFFRYRAAMADAPLVGADQVSYLRRAFRETTMDQQSRMLVSDLVPDGQGGLRLQVNPVLRAAIPDVPGGYEPLPDMTSMYLSSLPDVSGSALVEARSFTRHIVRGLRRANEEARHPEAIPTDELGVATGEAPGVTDRIAARFIRAGTRTPLAFYDVSHWLADSATKIGKSTLLATRAVPMIVRSGVEHKLRAEAAGFRIAGRGIFKDGQLLDSTIFGVPGDPRVLGGMIANLSTEDAFRTRPVESLIDPRTGPTAQQYEFLAQRLIHGPFSSPEMQELVRLGDGAKWADWMKNGDGQKYYDAVKGEIDRSTFAGDIGAFGTEMLRAIDQLTGGNDALRRSIYTGQLGGGDISESSGMSASTELERLKVERQKLRDSITAAFDEGEEARRAALLDSKATVDRRIRELNKTLRGEPGIPLLGPQEDIVAWLKAEYEAGNYTPPRAVVGMIEERTKLTDRRAAGGTVADAIQDRIYTSRLFNGQKWSVGAIDRRFNREPIFLQASRRYYDQLKGFGWDDAVAKEVARLRAARTVSDLFYNLTTRSSVDRFTRNSFWFAPLAESSLSNWLVRIPSHYYWPVGMAYLYSQAHTIVQSFKKMGLIRDVIGADGKKQPEVVIPGLGTLLTKLTGAPIKDIVTFNPRNFSPVAEGKVPFIPGVSPWYGYFLGKEAQNHHGIWQSISDLVQPFGTDVSFGPSALAFAYEGITGKQVFWEQGSPDYQQALYDSGFDDAIRQAWAKFNSEGRTAPRREDFPTDQAFTDAQTQYQKDLLGQAKKIYQAFSLVRLMGSVLSPFSLHPTDKYKRDMTQVLNDLYGLNDANVPPKGTPEYQAWTTKYGAEIDSFLASHPNGLAYTISKSIRTGAADAGLPYSPPADSPFYASLYDSARKTYSPADYVTLIMGTESRRYYQGQLQQALDAIGPTWADMYKNGYQRAQALADYATKWDSYTILNPGYQRLWRDRVQAAGGYPQSAQSELIATALRTTQELQSLLEARGASFSDIRSVEAALKQLYAGTVDFGPPTSDVAKGMAWYYDNVMTPYFKQVNPLWAQAKKLTESGQSASDIYAKIRTINGDWAKDKKRLTNPADGIVGPSPEEVFYGSLPPAEQVVHQLKWIGNPTTWLTNYQRETAGLPNGPGVAQLVDYSAGLDTYVQGFIDKVNSDKDPNNNISTSSNNYSYLINVYEPQALMAEAQKLGVDPQVALLLNAPAYQRVSYVGVGSLVQQAVSAGLIDSTADTSHIASIWKQITGGATYIIDQLTANGLSYKSDSSVSLPAKQAFYQGIDSYVTEGSPNYDQGFAEFMAALGMAMATKGNDQVSGALLYGRLFFDGGWN
jgi:hypothetical protein